MNKAATLETADREANDQSRADHDLAESKRMLKRLAQEQLSNDLRRDRPNLLATVKSIQRGL